MAPLPWPMVPPKGFFLLTTEFCGRQVFEVVGVFHHHDQIDDRSDELASVRCRRVTAGAGDITIDFDGSILISKQQILSPIFY